MTATHDESGVFSPEEIKFDIDATNAPEHPFF